MSAESINAGLKSSGKSIKFRRPWQGDQGQIERIKERHDFDLPNLANAAHGVAVDEKNRVVGYGIVKLMAEAILVLDLERSKKRRLSALEVLLKSAMMDCAEQQIPQLHVFVQDEQFAELLQNHFGFKRCVGIPLYLDTGDNDG